MVFSEPGRLVLIPLLLIAALTDFRTRRIPNWLTLAGFGAGLLAGFLSAGWSGLGAALLGGAAGFAVFFFIYVLGAMGAGDVKLMAAAGTFFGVPLIFWAAVCSAIFGGVLAMIMALRHRVFQRTVHNIRDLLSFWFHSGGIRKAEWLTLQSPGSLKLPYGVAIALGCAFVALFPDLSVF
jgi:prepilin peptidase CpaA